ncbi:uroporphyrinogen-III synthase [Herbaspirillum sp. LeCh32-8]|uniref:uroporphyrinogen-III synthase n=1 Tax=Herbaspirillum sp. LeCh32-8 TaxID=2821356 RepID=UPI001AE44CD3|nr:uroporphyrinogen-III synthase [Herbaspirillum sp. LeCh32-8]MBP0599574.1 uroporphyrinogen-III synthase [Herbaspirillum sp. LeCh32-8]
MSNRPDLVAHAVPVVVTRPLQQAQPFASRVEALGRRAEIFPLLVIEPVADATELQAALARLDQFALVVFVSPNAIDAAFRFIPAWPGGLPIGIVGEGSRVALRAHGVDEGNARIFAPQGEGKMDSEELLKTLPLAQLRGKRALIVRGQSGRDFLSDALQEQGVAVEHVTAYRRLAPPLDERNRARLLALADDGADWVVTSSEALRNLLEMTRLAGGDDRVVKLQRQRIFVSHHRIAQVAQSLGFCAVTLTGSGDERLLAALQSCP